MLDLEPSTTTTDRRKFVYRIDDKDQLIWFNSSWAAFAQENGASELNEASVMGKPIWSFISDRHTSQIYRELLHEVRVSSKEQKVRFRCDSPDCIRLMKLELRPLQNGQVEFVSTTIKQKYREPLSFLEEDDGESESMILLCSWCKKVRFDSDWIELEEAVNKMKLMSTQKTPKVSHGICEDCKSAML